MAGDDAIDLTEPPQGGRWWPEFWRGATQPSLPALLIAFSLSAGLFAAGAIFIRPELMAAGFASRLARDGEDDYCFVTAEALAISRSQPVHPAIFLFGASAVKESLSSPEELARLISQKTGVQPGVYNLSGADEVVWEMAALTDLMPSRSDSVMLLEVRPSRFCVGRQQLEELVAAPRLGFTSAAFDREAGLAGIESNWRSGCFFWDNRKFFLPRMKHLVKNLLLRRSIQYVEHRFLGDPIGGWNPERPEIAHMCENYDKHADECFLVYARIIQEQVQRRRATVVLVESPTNPRFISEVLGEDFYEEFQDRNRRFARTHGLAYWNPQEAARLAEDDFRDARHLRKREAQERYTAVLAEKLSEIILTRQMVKE